MDSKNKPIAVLISDVHYNLQTLPLADAAMRMAINKANELNIPLIVAGDLHDTKANLRGECANAMIKTLLTCHTPPSVLVGNHDKINEKSEDNSITFLTSYANIIPNPTYIGALGWLVPYYHDANQLREFLSGVDKGSRLIMHQGILESKSGEYFQDKSAIPSESLADFRVISGHYHYRQDIKCGRPQKNHVGLASYIGNPYTLSFSEANDPEKGFQILYDDGSLEFVPTNLRKHVILEVEVDKKCFYYPAKTLRKDDLVWIKVKGTREDLEGLTRKSIQINIEGIDLPEYFKLDFIPLETASMKEVPITLSQDGMLDSLIDDLQNTSDERKSRLKSLWKGMA